MKILIAVASRHGSTHEIADAMARELGTAGHTVDVQSVEAVPTVDESIASIIRLHQPKKAKTGAAKTRAAKTRAQRSRANTQRRRRKANAAASPDHEAAASEAAGCDCSRSFRLRKGSSMT